MMEVVDILPYDVLRTCARYLVLPNVNECSNKVWAIKRCPMTMTLPNPNVGPSENLGSKRVCRLS
jgi:hypothetical protein